MGDKTKIEEVRDNLIAARLEHELMLAQIDGLNVFIKRVTKDYEQGMCGYHHANSYIKKIDGARDKIEVLMGKIEDIELSIDALEKALSNLRRNVND